MEENLGVIEQALGIIFELRYSRFLNFGCYFAWVLWVTNFGIWIVESVDLCMFNLVFACCKVSIMLGYWFLGLIWVFWGLWSCFRDLKIWVSGFSAMLIAIMFLVIAISMKVLRLTMIWVWVDRDQIWPWSRSFDKNFLSDFELIAINKWPWSRSFCFIFLSDLGWSRSEGGLIAIRCCILGRFSLWGFKWDFDFWTVWLGSKSWFWRS